MKTCLQGFSLIRFLQVLFLVALDYWEKSDSAPLLNNNQLSWEDPFSVTLSCRALTQENNLINSMFTYTMNCKPI